MHLDLKNPKEPEKPSVPNVALPVPEVPAPKAMAAGTRITCRACGAHVYTTTRDLSNGDPLQASALLHPDGSSVVDGSMIVCPACGKFWPTISDDGMTGVPPFVPYKAPGKIDSIDITWSFKF